MDMTKLVTAREAARYLNVSHATIRRWVADEQLQFPYVKMGGQYRFNKESLDDFVRRNTHNHERAS